MPPYREPCPEVDRRVSVPNHRPYVWMLSGCVSFAIMSSMAHEVSKYINWQTVAFFRSFLVLFFVGSVCVFTKTPFVVWRPLRLWHRSVAGSVSLVTAFFALAKLEASTVVTLTNTFPIWVALLSWFTLGVFPSIRVWFAVFGGVAGVWLIQQPSEEGNLAFGLALFSSLSTAVAMLGLNKLKGVNPNAVVVHFSAVATVICTGAMFCFPFAESQLPFYSPYPLMLLLGVGVAASVGQMFLTRAFASGDPAKVSVVGLSQVVFAMLIDLFWAGRDVTTMTIVGTLLILAPTAWVILERRRPSPGPSREVASSVSQP